MTTNIPSSIKSPPPPPQPSYIREPTKDHHQSMIILHGRGDSGPSFGTVLVGAPERPRTASLKAEDAEDTIMADGQILPKALPHTRFIFPSATLRSMARFKDWPCNAWFDFYSLFDPGERPELPDQGLRENIPVIESLIEEEARKVGIENVILGGLSNGAAMALITVLSMIGGGKLHAGRRLGGVFGLCGWLPYAAEMDSAAKSDPDGHAGSKALEWLTNRVACREVRSSPDDSSQVEAVQADLNGLVLPIFLGHGKEDNVVPPERLHEARSTLLTMGFDVVSHEYAELGHWYSEEMLNDLVNWYNRVNAPQRDGTHSKIPYPSSHSLNSDLNYATYSDDTFYDC